MRTLFLFFASGFILFFLGKSSGQDSMSVPLNWKVTIDGISPENITKSQLAHASNLKADSIGISISSFMFSIYQKNKKPIVLKNSAGPAFTNEMKAAISDCQTGSKIFIEYIKFVDTKNVEHYLNPIMVKIK